MQLKNKGLPAKVSRPRAQTIGKMLAERQGHKVHTADFNEAPNGVLEAECNRCECRVQIFTPYRLEGTYSGSALRRPCE